MSKVIGETPEVTQLPTELVDPKSPGEQVEANPRHEMEDQVHKENHTYPDPEIPTEPKVDDPKVDEVKEPEKSPTEKVKEKIQRRIDKITAQKKSIEEELAETRAELEVMKTQMKPKVEADTKREPTDEEVRSALKKAIETGDIDLQVQITEYMADTKAKRQRAEAQKELEDNQRKRNQEAEKLQSDWSSLVLDYVTYDPQGKVDNSNELNLNNQNGLLYRTALALFNDKELKQAHYSDPDKIQAFRRAVGDAYREIHQNNLLKSDKSPKVTGEDQETETSKTKMRKVASLAEPGSDSIEEVTPKRQLTDTEVVIDEIKHRRRFQQERARE